MKLVIIAGGKGTRLGLKDVPKPMVKIAGKPILEHQIEIAKRYGLSDIYLLTGYLSNVIEDYFGDGSRFGVRITYIVEKTPLGTAGAMKGLENKFTERFMVFYGDTMMDIDLNNFIKFDNESESIASILVHPNNHPYDSDLVELDKSHIVTAFYSKPHDVSRYYRNMVNAALYILSPRVFEYIPDNMSTDFGKDIFPSAIRSKEIIRAYRTAEYIKDMGTPDRLEKTEKDYLSGKISRLNMSRMRKAIFLDRDGVINKEKDNLHRIEDFELIDGVGQAIKKINSSEFLCIVITNQPVIAKGFCTEEYLYEIHNKMETLLGKEGAFVDDIYYCPHHPHKGFNGEVLEYKIECECRKPKPGLILKAIQQHNIDIDGSYFIGDRYVDIKAGQDASLKTILITTGHAGNDKNKYNIEADKSFETLNNAVDYILKDEK